MRRFHSLRSRSRETSGPIWTTGLAGAKSCSVGRALEALQRGLFGGVGAEGVLVGVVGRGPESVAKGHGVVVGGGELDGAVAAAAAAVGGVVADADGDADDALMVGFLAGERAVVGDGLVGGDVVEAVLDEVGPLHAGEQ